MLVTVACCPDAGDALRSLWGWLRREDQLRGRVRLVERPPEPGQMGALPEALTVALGSGGAVAVLAGSPSVWLRYCTSDITVKLTGKNGQASSWTRTGSATPARSSASSCHASAPGCA